MAEAKVKIRADGRDLEKIGKAAGRAFDPRVIRRWEDQVKRLQTRHQALTSEAQKLTKELVNVKKGTEEYRRLERQLHLVEDRASKARRAVAGLNGAVSRARATQGAPGGASGGAGGVGGLGTMGKLGLAGLAVGGALAVTKMLASPVRSAMGAYGSFEQYQQARLSAAPSLGAYRRAAGIGRGFGLGPNAEIAAFNQLNLGAGGLGSTSRSAFGLALRMRNQLGVDVGQTGSMMAMFRPGMGAAGGQKGMQRELTEAVGAGILGGLHKEEIGRYLQQISSVAQEAATHGTKIDVGSIASLSGGMAQVLGTGMMRGGRVISGLTGGIRQSGRTGPQSAMDVALLKAAGWGGSGSISAAQLRLQEFGTGDNVSGDAGLLKSFFGQVLFKRGAKSIDDQTRQVQRAFAGLGAEIGSEEARRYAQLYETGGMELAMTGGLEEAGAAALAKKTGVSKDVLQAAELEGRRVEVGRKVAGGARAFRETGMQAVEALPGPALTSAMATTAEAMKQASKGLEKVTEKLDEATNFWLRDDVLDVLKNAWLK